VKTLGLLAIKAAAVAVNVVVPVGVVAAMAAVGGWQVCKEVVRRFA
jgi:hypothetical protein